MDKTTIPGHIKQKLAELLLIVAILIIYLISLISVLLLQLRRPRKTSDKISILLTGRVDSKNWANAHLLPLCLCENIGTIFSLLDGPIISEEKIIPLHPPDWLKKVIGRSPARSIMTIYIAIKIKPDLIAGYHFFPAALSALIAAKCARSKSLYQMTGGIREIQGAGIATENSIIPKPNRMTNLLKPLTIALCRHFDHIVVRGSKTKKFVLEARASKNVTIIPGSIDTTRFNADTRNRKFDLAFLGRLVPIKQPSQLIQIIAQLKKSRPQISAIIIGDGPLLPELKHQAQNLGLGQNIEFTGHIEKVEDLLKDAKIFLLTSRSESLSIALAEAMATGLVPVVPDVGDLSNLVKNDYSGFTVEPNNTGDYTDKILALLEDPSLREKLSENAKLLAEKNNSLQTVTSRWQTLLKGI